MPNRSGSTPAVANPANRASGVSPSSRTRRPLMTTTADAPSLICDEFPAVTVPSAWNAALSFASASIDVSRLGPSSTSNTAPPRGTGTISSAKRPSSMAAIAR